MAGKISKDTVAWREETWAFLCCVVANAAVPVGVNLVSMVFCRCTSFCWSNYMYSIACWTRESYARRVDLSSLTSNPTQFDWCRATLLHEVPAVNEFEGLMTTHEGQIHQRWNKVCVLWCWSMGSIIDYLYCNALVGSVRPNACSGVGSRQTYCSSWTRSHHDVLKHPRSSSTSVFGPGPMSIQHFRLLGRNRAIMVSLPLCFGNGYS